jgi:DNA-directed RNA polymerase
MAGGNRFWLTHKYDKRGRTYCQGYHVSYQGNDYNKACIEFADGEPLN